MSLSLWNTRTRLREVFIPIDPKRVRMYVCGPTVYDFAHIGNARPVLVFDILFRLLRALYGETSVIYARNITDVDDKITDRSLKEGLSISTLTKKTTQQFHEDICALGVLAPTIEPLATEHIPQMIALIERLLASQHAYSAEGHVLFDVTTMEQYGSLSQRSLEDMIAGARVEVAPYKKNAADFVLWKPSSSELPGWDSPWGRGRPGWHIECSAMSETHLGVPFDIHGGGLDLIFPHHENEIAQTCCSSGANVMANFWMHNGFLQVEGQKMSKSLGNFLTIREVLKDWPGDVVRLSMLKTHYRQPIDWTIKNLKESANILEGWHKKASFTPTSSCPQTILEALCDDLNTSQTFMHMHKMEGEALGAALMFLGFPQRQQEKTPEISKELHEKIMQLVKERDQARLEKDFAKSDFLRDELQKLGVLIQDTKDAETKTWKTTWKLTKS